MTNILIAWCRNKTRLAPGDEFVDDELITCLIVSVANVARRMKKNYNLVDHGKGVWCGIVRGMPCYLIIVIMRSVWWARGLLSLPWDGRDVEITPSSGRSGRVVLISSGVIPSRCDWQGQKPGCFGLYAPIDYEFVNFTALDLELYLQFYLSRTYLVHIWMWWVMPCQKWPINPKFVLFRGKEFVTKRSRRTLIWFRIR
jgi:hypothetical protein